MSFLNGEGVARKNERLEEQRQEIVTLTDLVAVLEGKLETAINLLIEVEDFADATWLMDEIKKIKEEADES